MGLVKILNIHAYMPLFFCIRSKHVHVNIMFYNDIWCISTLHECCSGEIKKNMPMLWYAPFVALQQPTTKGTVLHRCTSGFQKGLEWWVMVPRTKEVPPILLVLLNGFGYARNSIDVHGCFRGSFDLGCCDFHDHQLWVLTYGGFRSRVLQSLDGFCERENPI